MGRMYSISFAGEAESAQVDFFELRAPAGKTLRLHAVHIDQETEAGDAEEEYLRFLIKRSGSAATAGSGGTAAPSAVAMNGGDAAFSGTVGAVTNTTKISGGSPVTIHAGAFNVRAGLLYLPTPELLPTWSNQEYLTIELATTPADSVTFTSTFYVEELG